MICTRGGERNEVLQNIVFESFHFLVGLFPGYSSTSKLIWDTVENLLSWERLSYFYTFPSAETLFTGSPSCVPGFEYVLWLVCLEKPLFDWSIRVKGNPKITSGNSLGSVSPLGPQNNGSRRCFTDRRYWQGTKIEITSGTQAILSLSPWACGVLLKDQVSRLYFVFHTENHKKKQSNAMAQMQRQTFSCSELTFYFPC